MTCLKTQQLPIRTTEAEQLNGSPEVTTPETTTPETSTPEATPETASSESPAQADLAGDDFDIDFGSETYRSGTEDEVDIDLDFGPATTEAPADDDIDLDFGAAEESAEDETDDETVDESDPGQQALEAFRSELAGKVGEWYVVHTYSGMENRVLQNLENRVSSLNMEDYIYEVIVPTEEVTEIRNGQRKQVKRTVLPGYVLVRMDLTDESWSTVRHTPSVTGFVGHSNQPVPLSLDEVEKMLAPSVVAAATASCRRPGSPSQEGRGRRLHRRGLGHGGGRPVRGRARHDHRDQRQQPAAEGVGRDPRPGDAGRPDLRADPEGLTPEFPSRHPPRSGTDPGQQPRRTHTAMPPKKKVAALVKVALNAGAATPAPPVGTALGPHGVNIMEFCKAYNAATEPMRGNVIPVEITIYEDRSFTFITKTPPAAELIKKAAGVQKGSGVPQRDKVGKITRDQVREIANTKMPDLNANDVDAAMKIVEGTARSMGVRVEG